ncbi:MAG TPA: amidohydrolase family protein [Xanthobacteraceae bacterium]|nr:amidohydrolase family protein [Xanthobacteraceae bacterium]
MIVDAQVHIWKANTPDRPWLPNRVAQLPEPFTLEKLVPMMDEAGVDRAVIVPPSWEGDRNDYGLEAVRRFPGRFAVMGRIPLADPNNAALLPDWKRQPGMVGIRLTFHPPQWPWLSDGTADWFWPLAEKYQIPVMFYGAPMAQFAPIAERHPGLPLIADHLGVTGDIVKAGKLTESVAETAKLARFPNVSVKLSTTPFYSSESYPFRDMAVHIRKLFDAFGPRRCYWGTDLTNSFNKATYRQRVTQFTETLDFFSKEDKEWVMGRAILERLKWA